MLHTKTTSPEMTSNWQSKCARKGVKSKASCSVGIPSAEILRTHRSSPADDSSVRNSYEPNCYRHGRVMDLAQELEKLIQSLKTTGL